MTSRTTQPSGNFTSMLKFIGGAFKSLFESQDKKEFYRWKNFLA